MTDNITLEPANPDWPRLFEEEKARLLADFGSRFIAIEHSGSTAVTGLDAKPVIDSPHKWIQTPVFETGDASACKLQ